MVSRSMSCEPSPSRLRSDPCLADSSRALLTTAVVNRYGPNVVLSLYAKRVDTSACVFEASATSLKVIAVHARLGFGGSECVWPWLPIRMGFCSRPLLLTQVPGHTRAPTPPHPPIHPPPPPPTHPLEPIRARMRTSHVGAGTRACTAMHGACTPGRTCDAPTQKPQSRVLDCAVLAGAGVPVFRVR